MDLKTYIGTLDKHQLKALADACKTSSGHLRNCAYGFRTPSPELAVLLEKNSARAVTRQSMFPETFKQTWPELKAA